jgi:hypothetical protein
MVDYILALGRQWFAGQSLRLWHLLLAGDLVDLHEEQAEAVDGDAQRHHRDGGADPRQQRPFLGQRDARVARQRIDARRRSGCGRHAQV